MMWIKSWPLSATLGTCAVLGCGGDGPSGSGVSGSKTLGELSESEASKVCSEFVDSMRSVSASRVDGLCTRKGRAAAEAGDRCQAARSECIEQTGPEAAATWDKYDCDESPEYPVDGCEAASVRALEACLKALSSAYASAAHEFTCSADQEIAAPDAPAPCKALADSCPTLAGFSFNW